MTQPKIKPSRVPTGTRPRVLLNDPRMMKFKKGDLVQATPLYIKRQRVSLVPKDENTKGLYYGPARKDYVYVDWYASKPWDHLRRQTIHIKHIEPLGTPR